MRTDARAGLLAVILWLPLAAGGAMVLSTLVNRVEAPAIGGSLLLLSYLVFVALSIATYAAAKAVADRMFRDNEGGDPYRIFLRSEASAELKSIRSRRAEVGQWDYDMMRQVYVEVKSMSGPERHLVQCFVEEELRHLGGDNAPVQMQRWLQAGALRYGSVILRDEDERSALGTAGRKASDLFTKDYARSLPCPV